MSSMFDMWARDLLARRVAREGFDVTKHSFTVLSPRLQFVETLLTGHVKDFYYMSKEEVVKQSLMLHEKVLMEDPKFHMLALQFARHISFKKDQVVFGCLVRVARGLIDDKITDLLADFSPDIVLHRVYEQLKSGIVQVTTSRRRIKKLLAKIVEKWNERGKLHLYAIKYRRDLRDIIRISHCVVPRDIWITVFKLKHLVHEIENEQLRLYFEFVELVKARQYKDALDVAVKARLPFSIVRSAIPKSYWTEDVLRIMTPFDIAMFTKSLVESTKIPIDAIANKIRTIGDKVPAWYSARVMLHCLSMFGLPNPVTYAWGEVYAKTCAKIWSYVKVYGLDLEKSRILLIVDASGSMKPNMWTGIMWRGISAIAPLAVNVRQLILFSDHASTVDPGMLKTLDGWVELIDVATRRFNRGTNLASALQLALPEATRGEYTDVFIITDEQVNINNVGIPEIDLIRQMAKHATVHIVNPSPYPVHVTEPLSVRYIFAMQAEDVLTSLILTKMLRSEDLAYKVIQLTVKEVSRM